MSEGLPPRRDATARAGSDDRERGRFAVDYRYAGDSPLADRIHAGVYRQGSDTEQRTREERTTPSRQSQTRRRDSTFSQRIVGVFAQGEKALATGRVGHVLSYGIEYHRTENASLRDGGTFATDGSRSSD